MNRIPKIARTDIVISVVSGAVVASIAGAMVGHVAAGALGFVVAFLTTAGRQRQRAELKARIDNPASLHWEVVVNDVRVGSLSDPHYAMLEQAVFDDWRLYFAQMRNLVEMIGRFSGNLLFSVPVTLFWLGVAVFAFDPNSAVAMLDAMRTAPSSELIGAFARWAPGVAMVVAVPMCLFAILAAPRFGYENQFQAELGAAVRRRVQAAAEGRMLLVPVHVFRPA